MPRAKLEFLAAAEADAAGAQQWYAERSALAARAFLSELSEAVERVGEAPERWPGYLAGTRRYLFPNFPFSLIYRVSPDRITVVAVAHHRRKPGYWQARR